MKKSIAILILICIQLNLNAKDFSGEISGGNKATSILIRANPSLSKGSKWGVLSVINTNMPNKDKSPIYNYHLIQSALSYRITTRSKIKTGTFIGYFKNPKFYGYLAGLQAAYPFGIGVISINNQHQFAEKYTTSLVGVFELNPQISETLSFYTQVQIMSETDFKIATRNIQMIRLGLGYRKIQFGLFATLDQFKNQTIREENYGLFLRTTI